MRATGDHDITLVLECLLDIKLAEFVAIGAAV
jgi:hypothetical protein